MSKKKTQKTATRRATTPRTPAAVAATLLDRQLSNDQLYWVVLDQLSTDDFTELENAVMARTTEDTEDTTRNPEQEQDDRALATQEVYFMLGLELGRRLGGAR